MIENLKSQLNTRLSNLETRLSAIEDESLGVTLDNSQGQKLIREFETRCKHAINLVVYNFRVNPDTEHLDAFNELLLSVPNCKSIGGKPLPLKLTFSNRHDALLVLRKETEFAKRNIILKNDLTRNQYLYLKSLQAELNTRISEGENNLTIKYLDGIPTIVPKK